MSHFFITKKTCKEYILKIKSRVHIVYTRYNTLKTYETPNVLTCSSTHTSVCCTFVHTIIQMYCIENEKSLTFKLSAIATALEAPELRR